MLTPLDIENREFKRTMGGYNRDDVEDFMGLILNDYEKLYTENAKLRAMTTKEKACGTENAQDKAASSEMAQNIIKNAEKQAEDIVITAKNKANSIIENANIEIERLNNCYIELRKKVEEKKEVIKQYLAASIDMIVDDMVSGKNSTDTNNTEETKEK